MCDKIRETIQKQLLVTFIEFNCYTSSTYSYVEEPTVCKQVEEVRIRRRGVCGETLAPFKRLHRTHRSYSSIHYVDMANC